jgi:hypothetical protein
MKDPQLKSVYSWENKMGWNGSDISRMHAVMLIEQACRKYKVKSPIIKFHTSRALPYSVPEENIISLQTHRYLNIPITLHEAAHHIVWNLYGCRVQDHGPTFMGVYLDLLEGSDIDAYESAKNHGLKWKKHDLKWKHQ